MTEVQVLAGFVTRARFEDISAEARERLKVHLLDSLGCAIGALDGEPIRAVRAQTRAFGGHPVCTLIGDTGKSAPDRAAFYNGSLVRYLDFMDAYLAAGETCHPSDNFAPVFAAAEYAGAMGRDFLTALAVSYQVHARLSEMAPVRERGFDHTTQGAYAVGAGVAKALGLDAARAAHAIALAAVGNIALRVTRTGALSQWKGVAYPNAAFMGLHAAFLAMRGLTGPLEIFEGEKGFKESVSGPFHIEWQTENLERVRRAIIKRFNAEIHAQSAIEGILELRTRHRIAASDIDSIEIDIFDAAHRIIGSGREDPEAMVRTKEHADHSLRYMIAAALLDGELTPAQYEPARIVRDDVQGLLRRVSTKSNADYTARFPEEMPCRIVIRMRGGECFTIEKRDYKGFHTRPMDLADVMKKFDRLAAPFADKERRESITEAVSAIETISVRSLAGLLAAPELPRSDTAFE